MQEVEVKLDNEQMNNGISMYRDDQNQVMEVR